VLEIRTQTCTYEFMDAKASVGMRACVHVHACIQARICTCTGVRRQEDSKCSQARQYQAYVVLINSVLVPLKSQVRAQHGPVSSTHTHTHTHILSKRSTESLVLSRLGGTRLHDAIEY
jgi:hypothetical protein